MVQRNRTALHARPHMRRPWCFLLLTVLLTMDSVAASLPMMDAENVAEYLTTSLPVTEERLLKQRRQPTSSRMGMRKRTKNVFDSSGIYTSQPAVSEITTSAPSSSDAPSQSPTIVIDPSPHRQGGKGPKRRKKATAKAHSQQQSGKKEQKTRRHLAAPISSLDSQRATPFVERDLKYGKKKVYGKHMMHHPQNSDIFAMGKRMMKHRTASPIVSVAPAAIV
mmetsp:Transcript_4032/g.8631  ORF Transcript_4032/g.8631 Transcript_4032/m.8631 type:complete len:222 (-) Transcript_4032:225-890(-)